jgi:hypothetical protein
VNCNANCSGRVLTTFEVQDEFPCNCVNSINADAITWNAGDFKCELNCSNVANQDGQANETACECIEGYTWDPVNYACS